jgi:hypothetical protein
MDKNQSLIGLTIAIIVLFVKWAFTSQPEYHPVDDNDTQGEL